MLPPEFMTTAEVAKLLRQEPETVHGYVRAGKIRATKVGRRYLFTPQSVEEFVDQLSASTASARRKKPGKALGETL